jgi:hypothetical protein
MLPETNQQHVDNSGTGNAQAVPGRAAGMRFVFVNGRTPRVNPRCALCSEEIGDRYVREIGTRLVYCSRPCGAGHGKMGQRGRPFRAGSLP